MRDARLHCTSRVDLLITGNFSDTPDLVAIHAAPELSLVNINKSFFLESRGGLNDVNGKSRVICALYNCINGGNGNCAAQHFVGSDSDCDT